MARQIATVGDMTAGENVGCQMFPTPILTGSVNVFAAGRPVAFVGSAVQPHFCYIGWTLIVHAGRVVVTGSPTVFVNGRAAACVGSLIDCGDVVVQGIPTVNVI